MNNSAIDSVTDYWTTDKSTLTNWTKSRKPQSNLQRRFQGYIFRLAMKQQGFETETHHCGIHEWYSSSLAEVQNNKIPYRNHVVNAQGFDDYLDRFASIYEAGGYTEQYGGRSGYFAEKALEHYLSLKVLQPAQGQRVLDVASWGSPASEIVRHATPASCYKHDLTFTTDLAAQTIAGPAEAIEAPSDYFDSLMAHCAIDNFEGRSDVDLFREAHRILVPGGKFLIIPLHLADRAENLIALGGSGVPVDQDSQLIMRPATAARFARHYSMESLFQRITHQTDLWHFEVLIFEGLPMLKYPTTRNCRFALVATKI